MSSYATLADLTLLEGVTYTEAQNARATALLTIVSNLIRSEGKRVGIDVDDRADTDASYASVLKMITCDVVARAMRQSTTGDAMSQESQSALGYTWSGTYAVPGGGAAMALMDKERKMLGFKRQRYGVMKLWDGSKESV